MVLSLRDDNPHIKEILSLMQRVSSLSRAFETALGGGSGAKSKTRKAAEGLLSLMRSYTDEMEEELQHLRYEHFRRIVSHLCQCRDLLQAGVSVSVFLPNPDSPESLAFDN